jgi:hypothetical protein
MAGRLQELLEALLLVRGLSWLLLEGELNKGLTLKITRTGIRVLFIPDVRVKCILALPKMEFRRRHVRTRVWLPVPHQRPNLYLLYPAALEPKKNILRLFAFKVKYLF